MSTFLNVDKKWLLGVCTVGVTTVGVAFGSYKLIQYYSRKRNESLREQQKKYESQKLLHEYLIFHYGKPEETLIFENGPRDSLDFPNRCAELCLKHSRHDEANVPNRALDVGCAVGRSTFELTSKFEEVVGVDYSQSFVDACNHLKDKGSMSYHVTKVGDIVTPLEAEVNPSLNRQKTTFMAGDACNLPLDIGQFGCVLAANLICRLHNPQAFLDRTANLVAPGGILVITSPYSFSVEYTAKENWIGGYADSNYEEVSGFEGLKRHIEPFYDLVEEKDMPFLIRETERKNQWTVAHATVWRRK